MIRIKGDIKMSKNPYSPGYWPIWSFWSSDLVSYLRNKKIVDKTEKLIYEKIADYIDNSGIVSLSVDTQFVTTTDERMSWFDCLMFETFSRFKSRYDNRPRSLGIDVIEDIKDWSRETFPEFKDKVPCLVFK